MFKKRYTCLSLTTPRYFAKYDMMTTDAVEDRWKRSMRDKIILGTDRSNAS